MHTYIPSNISSQTPTRLVGTKRKNSKSWQTWPLLRDGTFVYWCHIHVLLILHSHLNKINNIYNSTALKLLQMSSNNPKHRPNYICMGNKSVLIWLSSARTKSMTGWIVNYWTFLPFFTIVIVFKSSLSTCVHHCAGDCNCKLAMLHASSLDICSV
jgi:hypothetical protein